MLNKIRLILIVFIFTIFLVSFVSAADMANIKNNQVSFSISSSQGIYPLAYLYQEGKSVKTISLCKQDKCPGTLNGNVDISSLQSGRLSLVYYSFDNYVWKNISLEFSRVNNPNDSQKNGVIQGNSVINTEPSAGKGALIVTICRLSHLFNSNQYDSCLKKYL